MPWNGPIANIRGPAGPSGGGYTHTQLTPSATWVVTHNLGRMVNVCYVDDEGATAIVDAIQELNVVYLTFPEPTTGKAVCSLWLPRLVMA